MKVTLELAGVVWEVDLSSPSELAVPLDFYGEQPRAFGLPRARAKAAEGGDFIGDRRRGGSANCEVLELIPHGNGTHTEGVGHITKERISVGDIALKPLIPAVVLTVSARRFGDSEESYEGRNESGDWVLAAGDLIRAFEASGAADEFLEAVVIRITRSASFAGPLGDHSSTNPPYFTRESIQWLRRVGCEHLLVEVPSVDREDDGGTLTNHHLFFGVSRDQTPSGESRARTITEMIEVPSSVEDGTFALALHVPRFIMDAAPSRPILYPLESSEC